MKLTKENILSVCNKYLFIFYKNEMELFLNEDRDFCDRCFYIVCREVFDKVNDGLTVAEVKEKIRRIIEND